MGSEKEGVRGENDAGVGDELVLMIDVERAVEQEEEGEAQGAVDRAERREDEGGDGHHDMADEKEDEHEGTVEVELNERRMHEGKVEAELSEAGEGELDLAGVAAVAWPLLVLILFITFFFAWLCVLFLSNNAHLDGRSMTVVVFVILFQLVGVVRAADTFTRELRFRCLKKEEKLEHRSFEYVHCFSITVIIALCITLLTQAYNWSMVIPGGLQEPNTMYFPLTRLRTPYPASRIVGHEPFWTSPYFTDLYGLIGMEAAAYNDGTDCFVPSTYLNSLASFYDPEGIEALQAPEITRGTDNSLSFTVDFSDSSDLFSIGLLAIDFAVNASNDARRYSWPTISISVYRGSETEHWWRTVQPISFPLLLLVKKQQVSQIIFNFNLTYAQGDFNWDVVSVSWQRRSDKNAWLTETADFFIDESRPMTIIDLMTSDTSATTGTCQAGLWVDRLRTSLNSWDFPWNFFPPTCVDGSCPRTCVRSIGAPPCVLGTEEELARCCRDALEFSPILPSNYLINLVLTTGVFHIIVGLTVLNQCGDGEEIE